MPIHQFTTRRRIEFADTDMGGIVHFSRFFAFMETAEHELLASIGAPVHFEIDGREVAWPRVAASCDYRSPARFGDELIITVRVVRKGTRSMTWGFDIRAGERAVATGRVTSVCCVMAAGGLESMPIPDVIAAELEEAPPQG